MPDCRIESLQSYDARFPLHDGAGSDAVHSESEYCFALTLLESDRCSTGCGLVLTLGEGNRLACDAIEALGGALAGRGIEVSGEQQTKTRKALEYFSEALKG